MLCRREASEELTTKPNQIPLNFPLNYRPLCHVLSLNNIHANEQAITIFIEASSLKIVQIFMNNIKLNHAGDRWLLEQFRFT